MRLPTFPVNFNKLVCVAITSFLLNVRYLAGQGREGDSIDSKRRTIGVSNFPKALRLRLDIDEGKCIAGWRLSKMKAAFPGKRAFL
ncbi:hypothetical protein DLD77_00850 [Chitinophaga alhagiae]|uniref:Secreted protein n=1 Tax=Chitinophaga alhagiae TaxID=2203219 RepID=A0ABM6W8T1_9BACT|nr:hypothetical protein DLD77_00850 [Chitinophaga alhagiae]